MKRLVNLQKVARMDNLIRHASTGTPEQFAKQLGMSRSTLFETIMYLKEEMNAPIIYDHTRPSYIYIYPPKFYLGFEREYSKMSEMSNNGIIKELIGNAV